MRSRSILLLLPMLACASSGNVVQRPAVPPPTPGHHVLAIVRVKPPWYAPRFLIRSKLREAVPAYEALPNLDAKYFTIGDDGRYGGIYLWAHRSAAEAFYDATWRRDVRERRGVDPDVTIFEAPLVFEGVAHASAPHRGTRAVDWPATATLTWWPSPTVDAMTLAREAAEQPDAMRGVVVRDGGSIGVMVLWASQASAQRYVAAHQADVPRPRSESFEVPVAIDSSLR